MKKYQVQHSTVDLISKDEMKQGLLPSRYLVAFMGFLAYAMLNCHILSTSIAVVAMVKYSHVDAQDNFNNQTYESCPQNVENETDFLLQKTEGEFVWSPEIEGYVLGASFLGFVITHMPGGLLGEIFGAKIVINSGLLISSICHLVSPFAARSSSYLLIAVQLLRGMGQGLMPASTFVLSANWYPQKERGFLTTFTLIGLSFGSVVGGAAGGALCSSSLFGGWPSVFYIFGVMGIVLSILYTFVIFESPKQHPRIAEAEMKYILENQETELFKRRPPTPWLKILTSIPFYAMTIALFGQFWTAAYFQASHPIFIGTILHYSIAQNGLIASIPFVLQAAFTAIASWVSNWLTTKDYVGINKVRKGCNLLSCAGYAVCILGVYLAGCNKVISTVCAMLASAFGGFDYSGATINSVELSPVFSGSLTGLTSFVGCSANYIVPIFVGLMTQKEQTLEQWNKIFLISIAVVMTSGITFAVFGSAEVQPWNYSEKQSSSQSEKEEEKESENQKKPITIDTIPHNNSK